MRSSHSLPRVLFGRFTASLAVALAVVVGGLVGINVFIDKKIESIPRVHVKVDQDTDPGQPANFVLIGSDTRDFAVTPEDQQAYGGQGSTGGQRSDTLMVVHVEPAERKGILVSFPRDTLVDIPGVGRAKVNAAYDSGPQKVIDTLQSNFGIKVQHYLEVNFPGFKGIVDAMGGVPVYFPAPARDKNSGLYLDPFGGYVFKPGCYRLDGDQALGYARSREYEQFIDGRWELTGQDAPDIHRIERQQTFMRRLATEAVHKSVRNPLDANRIADKTIPKLKVDSELGRSDINKLITAFRHVDPNDPNSIQMITLPTIDGGTVRGQRVLQLKEPDADAVLQVLKNFGPPPTSTPGQPPSSVRVRVFNGTGVNGAANQTASALQKYGFVDAGVGNNPGGRIARTEVRYRAGSENKAKVVQSYLGGVGALVEDRSIVEADVTVALGRDFKAVSAPPNAAAAAPAPGPSPTTAPPPSPRTPGSKGGPPVDPTQC